MPTRRSTRKKSPKTGRKSRTTATAKPQVSRYEYAQVCMQVATLQAHVTRNRTDLDIQLRRIAQLQDELDTLKKALATTAFPPDAILIPLPKTTT
jgi:hypothetical protein